MRYLSILFAFASLQAFGCPDLTGTYTCIYDKDTADVSISQKEQNGATIYIWNGSEVPANGVQTSIPDAPKLSRATFKAWCDPLVPTHLFSRLKGHYSANGLVGTMTMNQSFSLQGSTLKQITQGTIKSKDGEQTLSGETTCIRKSP